MPTVPASTKTNRTRWWVLIGVVLLAALLRGWAVMRLPIDADEPVYLDAAYAYAKALRAGDWNAVIDYPDNREHPALVKLLYGLNTAGVGQDPNWQIVLLADRALSALFGTATVGALAFLNPLAGALLAVHTMTVKYTSQVYLEALPHLASLVAVLAFSRSTSARDRWYWFSAVALGVTAAGKLAYLPVVLVVFYLARWEKRFRWVDILLYLAVAVAVFWLLNPTLWRDPLVRLYDSLFFHLRYSRGEHVQQVAYPWYQPLYWISRSPPSLWHPDVFFYFGLDGVISSLAVIGCYWEWRRRRWVVVWIITNLIFLLLWPTKWPQYTLVLVPALCLAASSALIHLFRWLRAQEMYWNWLREMVPSPPLAFWIACAGLIIAVTAFYTVSTVQMTLGRLNWSHFTTQVVPLPSNTVNDMAAGPDGQMILGTNRGAVIWSPVAETELPDDWTVFSTKNSGLADDRVLAVARDQVGNLWFGTASGLSRYDGTDWVTYRAEEMGLAEDRVNAVALGTDARVWVGTGTGAAVFDGRSWTPLTAGSSGLVDNQVLSLAVESRLDGDWIWFGTQEGISRLDTVTGRWQSFTAKELDLDWGGVVDLMIDSSGRLWAGTLGAGLGLWDGDEWQFFRTGNSEIPFNWVNAIEEVEPGLLWLGIARPAEVGGLLVEFDGDSWTTVDSRNSGFSGGEPLVIASYHGGQRWVGTRTKGIDIYLSPHAADRAEEN
jgi:ligand-binding sensor domain-containing protein